MRYLLAFLLALFLFSGEQVWAQRTGPGLFLGPGMCSDVTGQVTQQTYCLDYSSGSLLVWNGSQWVPISGNLTQSLNTATGMGITNTSNGTNAQTMYTASNGTYTLSLSISGTGSTFPNPPWPPNEAYLDTTGPNGLLFYPTDPAGVIKFAANGQGAAGTLNLNEDSSGNFGLQPSNGADFIQFTGGNPVVEIVSTTDSVADIAEFLPENRTIGVGIWYNGIRMMGSTASLDMQLDAKGGGTIDLGFNSRGDVALRQNGHLRSMRDGAPSPTINTCSSGAIVAGSTDVAGAVTITSGATNNCFINFGAAWPVAPSCMVQGSTNSPNTGAMQVNTTTTVMNFINTGGTLGSALAQYHWICVSN